MGKAVLDEYKMREICAILNVGGTPSMAARYVGCCRRTISNTARLDDEFAVRLKRAESMHELIHLKHVNSAAANTRYWRAAAWVLERKYPQRWAARGATTVTPGQVAAVLDRFTEIVCSAVDERDVRDRILQRLTGMGLGGGLTVAAAASTSDEDGAVHDDRDSNREQPESRWRD